MRGPRTVHRAATAASEANARRKCPPLAEACHQLPKRVLTNASMSFPAASAEET
jgi:hypothetical protein